MNLLAVLLALNGTAALWALNPSRALTQYSKTTWTQQQGLPQDTIRAIAQTRDGFLWLGTDEGITRFDGYEFTTYGRTQIGLPSNSVATLAAGPDGSLWIGTPAGLGQWKDGRLRTFAKKDGLVGDSISALLVDHAGILWIVAAGKLSSYDGKVFTSLAGLDHFTVRGVTEDAHGNLYITGYSAVIRLSSGSTETLVGASVLKTDFPQGALVDQKGDLWVRGVRGLIHRSPDGRIDRLGLAEGLPGSFGLNALAEDRRGNLWFGTQRGLARLESRPEGRRAILSPVTAGQVQCVFEDKEGNLWFGSHDGLTRLRDESFTVYGKTEGLASDEPNTVFEDHSGRVWVGFLEDGIAQFPGSQVTTTGRVYAFHETSSGELLVSTREGLLRRKADRTKVLIAPDPLGRKSVYQALEAKDGKIWMALPNGLGQLDGDHFTTVIPGGSLLESSFVTLAEAPDGVIWAGSYRNGLWSVTHGKTQLYTSADGLGSNYIRDLHFDADGRLWVATFGGGISFLHDGKFSSIRESDGLLSDNVSKIVDDGESLWLSTTRGICRILKRDLLEPVRGRRVPVTNYGVADGMRSAESPSELGGAGGGRHRDGTLWFVTTRGIAVFDPRSHPAERSLPNIQILDIAADGVNIPFGALPQVPAGSSRLRIRYAALHLRAPDIVRYSYRLNGSDPDWVPAGTSRVAEYTALRRGRYTFDIRAELPGGLTKEESYSIEVLPRFYETVPFQLLTAAVLAGMIWGMYQWRERQVRSRFALVLEERARLAREVHDTLAQGFVGIASQLDAVAMSVPDESPGRSALDLARKMTRHSLTEARRSMMDLRSGTPDDQDLEESLRLGTRLWVAGTGAIADVQVTTGTQSLPENVAHQILRIAQEAVVNAVKHGGARHVTLKLAREARSLTLSVTDDGLGFDGETAFQTQEGHFGLIGMRERAESLGGVLHLRSQPGKGAELLVSVPLQ